MAIAAHVQYGNLSSDGAWQQLQLAEDAAALVAAARQHANAADLTAVSSTYVDLLAERIADAPAAAAVFAPLCAALGGCLDDAVQIAPWKGFAANMRG